MTSLDGINGKSIQRLLKFKLGIYHQGLQMLTRAFKKEGQYSFLFQLKTPCGEGKKIPMVFYTILVWNRVWFSRKLQECMNILIVSIPWPNE